MQRTTSSRPALGASFVLVLITFSAAAMAENAPGFVWNLETRLLHDDNVYRTTDNLKESDNYLVVKPELSWRFLRGKHQFNLSYQGDYGLYSNNSDLDYNDHDLMAHALLDHSHRLTSEYTLSYRRGHDQPGQTDALSTAAGEVNKWRDTHADAQIAYGRDDSIGQIIARFQYHQKRFTNNNMEYRDYNLTRATGAFFYRIAPKTRMLFEVEFSDYDYQNNDISGTNQSGQEHRYLTGVTWKATAKTTGIFKVGYRNRTFDNSQYEDLSGLALWLDAIWKPNTYTKVALRAADESESSAQQSTGGYVRRYLRASIDHGITPRTLVSFEGLYGRDAFEGTPNRDDDRITFRAGVTHSLRRWLDIGAQYRYEKRDSTLDNYDYRSNVFMLTVATRFE